MAGVTDCFIDQTLEHKLLIDKKEVEQDLFGSQLW